MERYWYEVERWDGEVIELDPGEGKEAAIQHALGGVFISKRQRMTLSMKDVKEVSQTSRVYGSEPLLPAGEVKETLDDDKPVTRGRGVLVRWVKKKMPYKIWHKSYIGHYKLLRSDDDSGDVWVVRSQIVTRGNFSQKVFANGWYALEDWEYKLMERKTQRA
jgi:hypothetical protein